MEQRSPEWFEARKGRITGSVVGAILGLNPYKTANDVMRDMINDAMGISREFQGNDATAYGTLNEPGAIMEYEMLTGNQVEKCGFYTYEEWLGASPDGLVGDDGLVEIKCPYKFRNDPAPSFKTLAEQPYYAAQVQIQLFVTDRKWCDFFQWSPNGTWHERVDVDRNWLLLAIPALRKFYDEYQDKLLDSALSGFPDPADIEALNQEYDYLKLQIERMEARRKAIIDELVQITNGLGGEVGTKKLTFVERKGNVNYSQVVKDFLPEVNLDNYRGEGSSYWVLK